jgi:hypothetical protein
MQFVLSLNNLILKVGVTWCFTQSVLITLSLSWERMLMLPVFLGMWVPGKRYGLCNVLMRQQNWRAQVKCPHSPLISRATPLTTQVLSFAHIYRWNQCLCSTDLVSFKLAPTGCRCWSSVPSYTGGFLLGYSFQLRVHDWEKRQLDTVLPRFQLSGQIFRTCVAGG